MSGLGTTRRMKTASRRTVSELVVKKAALGFRFFGFVFCLVSFSVMASDRNKGWAVDSFNRYIEFRYAALVNLSRFMENSFFAFLKICATNSKEMRSVSFYVRVYGFKLN